MKERLRPLLFPEENPFVCPSVRAGSAIENASRWSVIGRAGSAVENASRTPSHPTDHGLSEFIYKIGTGCLNQPATRVWQFIYMCRMQCDPVMCILTWIPNLKSLLFTPMFELWTLQVWQHIYTWKWGGGGKGGGGRRNTHTVQPTLQGGFSHGCQILKFYLKWFGKSKFCVVYWKRLQFQHRLQEAHLESWKCTYFWL